MHCSRQAADEAAIRIKAEIAYTPPGARPVFYPGDRARSHLPVDSRIMPIRDARLLRSGLDIAAFEVRDWTPDRFDPFDDEDVRRHYYPQAAAFVADLLGVQRTVAFGHVTRSERLVEVQGRQPSVGAHIDFQTITALGYVRDVLGEAEAARLAARRLTILNLWRPLAMVERSPLAIADSSTIRRDDLMTSTVYGALMQPDKILYGYMPRHDPRHRWYYVPAMRPDELLVFRNYDSDAARAQWAAHTAFTDPTAPADAAPRESIEIRVLAFH